MKKYLCVLLLAQFSPAAFAATADAISATERIGIVQFHASCAPAVRASFDRGIALLHDFWYDEAKAEFERIAARDPGCGLAHWGAALSVFHQLWDRPDDAAVAYARAELALAQELDELRGEEDADQKRRCSPDQDAAHQHLRARSSSRATLTSSKTSYSSSAKLLQVDSTSEEGEPHTIVWIASRIAARSILFGRG